jgi:C4-dicarboxylate-specific signal transduction histidine kinase
VDGIYRWHLSRAEPLRDKDGQIVQWFGVAIDIDERRRAEDHLRETRAKLAGASRIATVAELSASIAHELNQPLTAVIAHAQAAWRWISNSPPNFSEAMASIERVLRDGRVADERMQHIRALFKQQPLRKKHAWPSQIISEAIRFVHEDAKKDGIPIDVQIAGDLPPIVVEQIQIQEVLINLISNGIEAMESNVRRPHLTIRAILVSESELLIEIMDNGPGLKDAQSIFDAFVTTKEKGMGIGLAVSRSIIEAHDGQLWAENNPDYGAKFSIRLPVASVRSDEYAPRELTIS